MPDEHDSRYIYGPISILASCLLQVPGLPGFTREDVRQKLPGTPPLLEQRVPPLPIAGTLLYSASPIPAGEWRFVPGELPRFPETLPHFHRGQRQKRFNRGFYGPVILPTKRGVIMPGPVPPPPGTAPLLESDAPWHPTAGTLLHIASPIPAGECRFVPGELPRFPEPLPHPNGGQRQKR